MSQEQTSFQAGIDFDSVLRIISKQVYETPLAFIRENVQNAVDAVRVQAYRDGALPGEDAYRIEVGVEGREITVCDNGIGMTEEDLKKWFWTIGASGKRTTEAQAAGCVGTFGIGGFANFGVCDVLEVVSQSASDAIGTLTRLSESDIKEAGSAIPRVSVERSELANPRGTVVRGHLRDDPRIVDVRNYLQDFVRFVPIAVYFNGQKISQYQFADTEDRPNYKEITDKVNRWSSGEIEITGRLFEDRGNSLVATIESLSIGSEPVNLAGVVRFENGAIDVFKHGFKLCATQIPCAIGVSGRLDCDLFVPTAGRDSLDAETTSLLTRIVALLEEVAIETVLENTDRIAEHTRIFRYVIRRGLVGKLGNIGIQLADGSQTTLGDVREKAQEGNVGVFFGVTQNQALNQIMQAKGHLVAILSADRYRQEAERQFLEAYCNAKPFDGMVDCVEMYQELNRFEKVFLSQLELNIARSYEVDNYRLTAGKLTEDIPVLPKEHSRGEPLEIIVDVRHSEITKLKGLGFTPILYSLISTFCHEYLGAYLKKWSPKFFGNGAINLDLISRRSELWVLVKDDIGVVQKVGKPEVISQSDVQTVDVRRGEQHEDSGPRKPEPRILLIIDEDDSNEVAGYYIRVPDIAYGAYGDLIQSCDYRGLSWVGNKITFVASDAVSAAFQYEIRLDELVVVGQNGSRHNQGADVLDRTLQQMYEGLYFPIPASLESFLVPKGDQEIRLDLYCDWIDMRTASHWITKEAAG